MASELHALIIGFDHACTIRGLLEEIVGQKVDLDAYVDSKTVFDAVATDRKTTETGLRICISALRESYGRGELMNLGCMTGCFNPAEALPKQLLNTCTPL